MLELLLILAPPLAAPPVTPSDELELVDLDSPVGARSALPNLLAGADGEVYLTWCERRADDTVGLSLAVLGEQGWSEPREIVRGTDFFWNWADFPSLCALESGVLMAHWLRAGEDPHGYNAEFSLSSDGGRSWSAPRVLHEDLTPAEHGFVSIAPLDEHSFGAIWLDGSDAVDKPRGQGETQLRFRTISDTGELGAEEVIDPRVCDCCQTSLIATPGGGLLAAYRDRSAEEVRDIGFARFDGERWSKPALVHADDWLIPGCPVNGPRLARRAGGEAALWFTGVGEGGGNVLLAFGRGDAAGFGAPLDVDDGVPLGRVDLVYLDDDSVLLSWMEHTEEGAEWRVRRVSKDWKRGESLTVAEVPGERSAGFLRMAVRGPEVILAWTSEGAEGGVETARVRFGG